MVVLFGLVSFGRSVYTDLLWFDSLDLRSIFVKVTVTRIALFAIGTAVAAVAIGVSLWLAHRHSAGEITLSVPSEVLTALRRSVTLGSIAAVIVLSLILGSVLAARWELFLKFTNSVPFNQNDPVYGLDLGFYIFICPSTLSCRDGYWGCSSWCCWRPSRCTSSTTVCAASATS